MQDSQLARSLVTAPREHIVCVDDEEGILDALRQQLTRFEDRWEIDLARSAQEAIELLDELDHEGEPVAMVIVDQIMPGMKGVELLELVHARQPGCVKILLTGQAGLDSVVKAVNRASLDRYIAKPWDEQDLRMTVSTLLDNYRLARENRQLLADLRQKNNELLRLNMGLDRKVAERTRELAEANRRLSQLAITDGLTGLFNHRHFHERLEKEVERSKRIGLPLSLLMIDVDHFKAYNDRNGHPAGDAVLRQVAQLLTRGRRVNDIVARYGGEEFAVLLLDTPGDSAKRVAEQLRHRVAGASFENGAHQPSGRLTISVGVATLPGDAETDRDLVAAADRALYAAKNRGRNRVAAAAEPE